MLTSRNQLVASPAAARTVESRPDRLRRRRLERDPRSTALADQSSGGVAAAQPAPAPRGCASAAGWRSRRSRPRTGTVRREACMQAPATGARPSRTSSAPPGSRSTSPAAGRSSSAATSTCARAPPRSRWASGTVSASPADRPRTRSTICSYAGSRCSTRRAAGRQRRELPFADPGSRTAAIAVDPGAAELSASASPTTPRSRGSLPCHSPGSERAVKLPGVPQRVGQVVAVPPGRRAERAPSARTSRSAPSERRPAGPDHPGASRQPAIASCAACSAR